MILGFLAATPGDDLRELAVREALVQGLYSDARSGSRAARAELLGWLTTPSPNETPLVLRMMSSEDLWAAFSLEPLLLEPAYYQQALGALWDAFPEVAPEIALGAYERAKETRDLIARSLAMHGYAPQSVVDELEASCPPVGEQAWGILFVSIERTSAAQLVAAYVCKDSYARRNGLRTGDEIVLGWDGWENPIPAFLHGLEEVDFVYLTVIRPTMPDARSRMALELMRPLPSK